MVLVTDLLDVLLAGGSRADRLTHLRRLPVRAGEPADWPTWADPALVAGYQALGIEQPWRHQVQAADSARSGQHTVLATSTGSGKSLAFWLPALTAVRDDAHRRRTGPARIDQVARRGTVLYLCPTKALAADQLTAVQRLLSAAGADDLRVTTCDGDTGREERRWVVEHADAVLTNPDFLHYAVLPQHRRWARLLGGLRYVVLDECHAFRGVFGAHVAIVLRRLRRLAALYGADPVFLLASATTADPAVSAARLIGVTPQEVHAVQDDASPAGRKTIALWQPPELPGSDGPWTDLLPDEDPWALPHAAPARDRPGPDRLPQDQPAQDQPASDGGGAGAPPATAGPAGATPTTVPPGAEDGRVPGATSTPASARPTGDGEPLPPDPLGEPAAAGPVGTGEDEVPDPERPRRSVTTETADLLADLTAAGARSLAFTRSRRGAESVATMAREHLHAVHPALAAAVAAYRGGYLPEERRDLEAAIRSGQLRALATTSALELGVDISGLDVVLVAGWPGTRVSWWQQAGRAGRAGADGLVVLVAREDPLDTYLVHHPEAVLDAPVEATVFDPANPYVLAPHLCAAAAESPLRAEELGLFGSGTRPLLDTLVEQGALRRRPSGWYWTHPEPAVGLTDLRGTGGNPVRVVEASTGRLLGTVDAASADSTVHTGAVYVHQGATYVVEDLNLADGVALAERRDVDYGTWSRWVTSVEILSTVQERTWGPVTWGYGAVDVTSQVMGYQRRRLPDLQVLSSQTLDLPARNLTTAAVWWTAPAEILEQAGVTQELAPGALHAAEHASIGLLPLLATCDRWDLGGVSTAMHADTEHATVFVYDGHPGGAGFAERGFDLGTTWLRATRDAIAGCPCRTGCPACVQSPKCGNGNSPLEKTAAVRLLDAVLTQA